MWAIILTLLKNPKNLAIVVFSILLLASGLTIFIYREKSKSLHGQIIALQIENVSLKEQLRVLDQHAKALEKKIEIDQKILTDYDKIQKKINDLKKTCPQVISVKEPKVRIPVTVKPTPEIPNSVIVKPIPEISTPVIKSPDDSGVQSSPLVQEKDEDKIINYSWGGIEYEKKAIDVYNSIVDFASGVHNNAALPNLTRDQMSSSDQTCPTEIGFEQDVSSSGQFQYSFREFQFSDQVPETA